MLSWIYCYRYIIFYYRSKITTLATGFPVKRCVRKDCIKSLLMIHHYPDLACASDWLKLISLTA